MQARISATNCLCPAESCRSRKAKVALGKLWMAERNSLIKTRKKEPPDVKGKVRISEKHQVVYSLNTVLSLVVSGRTDLLTVAEGIAGGFLCFLPDFVGFLGSEQRYVLLYGSECGQAHRRPDS